MLLWLPKQANVIFHCADWSNLSFNEQVCLCFIVCYDHLQTIQVKWNYIDFYTNLGKKPNIKLLLCLLASLIW